MMPDADLHLTCRHRHGSDERGRCPRGAELDFRT